MIDQLQYQIAIIQIMAPLIIVIIISMSLAIFAIFVYVRYIKRELKRKFGKKNKSQK